MTAAPQLELGRYRTVELLGSGAMGVVYLAHDPGIDRYVALKTIRKELLGGAHGAGILARFRNEAVTAGRLSHPGIVTVYEFAEDASTAFIAMELAPGVNLSDYVSRRRGLSLADIQDLMGQLLDALHYAHGRGVVHRDIKPANLLVSDTGRLKIPDSGIARLQDSSLTRTGAMIGTPSYMAPEQYQGSDIDHRVDIFASGVLLYELLTGAPPFNAETIEAIAYQICHTPHVPPSQRNPHVPPELDAVVARALAKRKEDRFASAWEMARAISPAPGAATNPTGNVSPNAQTAAAPAPAKAVATATAWSPESLKALEAALLPSVGPIAKVMVKRAAAQSKDFDDLCARLSGFLANDQERAGILKQVASLRGQK